MSPMLFVSPGPRRTCIVAERLKPPTGHVFRVERKRGPAWYAKYRLPDAAS
jgi:hypothetical protein